jgi:hypothetical protein
MKRSPLLGEHTKKEHWMDKIVSTGQEKGGGKGWKRKKG